RLAFFPLLPLLIHLAMASTHLPFEVVGTVINNGGFLAALLVVYRWVDQSHGPRLAQWCTAVVAWCPFSLFGTVIYTEGLFLAFSTAALYTFQHRHYGAAALWGALATATRVTGLALVPTFLLVAWRQQRSWAAYLSALGSTVGIALYSAYCGWRFHEPLGFIKVQHLFWQQEQDFWGQSWIKMFAQVTIGSQNWKQGHLVDPWHPLIVVLIAVLGYSIWHHRQRLQPNTVCYLSYILILGFWILAGNPLVNTVVILGGAGLVALGRHRLGLLAWVYGLSSFAIIFSSGRTTSAERYTYGIISVSLALGFLLARHPRWGQLTLGFFGVLLLLFSIRFSQHLWVA
ncbi:hypothetical protein, partial [Prochlorothrix hollandica]|uniref:hypothetical protein n=1 Tax=Prochlorothrix hollandica TaxID=1223 RepID=UPI00333E9E74